MHPAFETTRFPVGTRRQSAVLGRAALTLLTAPLLWLCLAWLGQRLGPAKDPIERLFPSLAGSSALLALSAVLLAAGHRSARWILVPAMLVGTIPFVLHARQAPDVAFLAVSWAVIASALALSEPFRLASFQTPEPRYLRPTLSPPVIVTGATALVAVTVAAGQRVLESRLGFWSAFALFGTAAAVASTVEWILVRRGLLARAWAASLTALSLGAAGAFPLPTLSLGLFSLRTVVALAGAAMAHEAYGSVVRALWARPSVMVVVTFAVLGALGGLLLTLPGCTTRPISDLDALFTAVSASCVTGLTVLDTPTDFTFLGQLLILVLIQVGGLGIMTLSAVAVLFLRGTLTSGEESALGEVVGAATPGATRRLVVVIAISTFSIEALGAAALFPAFWAAGVPPLDALWKGVFHSVSAFCNAGFALQTDSLIPYANALAITLPIEVLIVLGGIGFSVLLALYDLLRRRRNRLSLHSALAIATSAVLLAAGGGLFLLFESGSTATGAAFPERLQAAMFQSVTARTAGFNTVDLTGIGPHTAFLLTILMFIGASPVSTGGGIKTTTAAVLFLGVRALVIRSGGPQALGRSISTATVYRAAAVLSLSLAIVSLGFLGLLATQRIAFEKLIFETVSAFGTVGLSIGATPLLDPIGKVIVIILMLAGRTGPLTLVLLFQERARHVLRYPAEEVVVG